MRKIKSVQNKVLPEYENLKATILTLDEDFNCENVGGKSKSLFKSTDDLDELEDLDI